MIVKRLGQICKLKQGFQVPVTNQETEKKEGLVRFIRIVDYTQKTDDLRYIKERDNYYYVKNDDVVMVRYGATAGEVGHGISGVIANNLFLIDPITDVNKEYLYYFLSQKKIKRQLLDSISSSAMPALNFATVSDLSVPLWEIDKQNTIVKQLDILSNILHKRVKELDYLDNLIKARFVEMFGDPASNPKKWYETTIGEECFYIKDGPHKSLADIGQENGGHPFISVRNIVNHVIDFSTARYISDEDYEDAIKKCHPEKGDMLYSKGGTTGIAKLIDVDVEFANWVHVAVLKFHKDKLNGVFFENMLNSDYCYEQSQRLTKGIANRDLVLSAMVQIKMYRPPMELQEKFAEFVKQVDKSKFAVQKSLQETQMLFDSLMQKYFG